MKEKETKPTNNRDKDGKFKKGFTANPTGRPRGAGNKSTERIKSAFGDLIENNLDNLQIWLNRVATENPEAAIKILATDLAKYVLPTLTKSQVDATIDTPDTMDLSHLSEEDLYVVMQILKKPKDEQDS